MKNITLAIDERVLADARRYAAEHDTTVNAMVRDHLASIADTARRAKGVRARLLRLVEKSKGDMGNQKWERSKLYER